MINILVIQLTRLGDIIQSIPLLDDLIKKHPEAKIYLLVNDVFKDSCAFLKDIQIIPVVLEEFVRVKDNEYLFSQNVYFKDLMHFLNSKFFKYVFNLNNSLIARHFTDNLIYRYKYGFGYKSIESKATSLETKFYSSQKGIQSKQIVNNSPEWAAYINSFLKSRQLNSMNLVDIFRRFLSPDYNSDYEYSVFPASLKEKSIALQCGARNIKRHFTQEQYVDIANHYLRMNYTVYLLGLENERNTARLISEKISKKGIVDLTGKTSLSELLLIISRCERVFTPDTGTMHLAALCNTPFTSLFAGPAYPFETLAYSKNAEVFMPDPKYISCYPCKDDEICPFKFECQNFSFKKYFLQQNNDSFIQLDIVRDEIGQTLLPVNETAVLWRAFTKFYFYNKAYSALINISAENKSLIKRELKLWNILNTDNLQEVVNNFEFLKPLLFYKKLNQGKGLVKEAIAFFERQINE